MRGLPVNEIVYEHLFTNPKPTDPQNFEAFVQRRLLAEIRDEAKAFYGTLDTQEAKYPGIDYLHPTHRLRLSRWPWHRRLFRAFHALRLTPAEIRGLAKWEGTKWAKEKFEKEHGIIIKDTTGDDIVDWVPPSSADAQIPRAPQTSPQTDFGEGEQPEQQPLLPDSGNGEEGLTSVNQGERHSIPDEEEEQEREEQQEQASDDDDEDDDDHDDNDNDDDNNDNNDDDDDDDNDNDEFESVGVDLNERLRDRATRRDAGDTSVVLDEQWEQWLKNAIDSGELTLLTEQMTEQMYRRASSTSVVPAALIPPGMLLAARSGQWSEIPEVLHPMLLRTLEAASPSTSPSPSPRSRPGAGAGLGPRTRMTGLSDSVATRHLTMPRPTRPTIRLPSAQGAF
ncbi:hypothetical protein E4U21_000448 [Claviceps maximensis]|nr:hypothetical protein E4U21_000448 [Claviceps maximensis]